jgi:hypothetical protein
LVWELPDDPHGDQRRAWPIRVSLAQKIRDVFSVAMPRQVGVLLRRTVAGFRGLDQIDRDRDMCFEQFRESAAGGLTEVSGVAAPMSSWFLINRAAAPADAIRRVPTTSDATLSLFMMCLRTGDCGGSNGPRFERITSLLGCLRESSGRHVR